jgi:phage baseplate assembly protein W
VAKTLTQSFKDLNLGFKKHPVTDDVVVTKDEAAIKQAIVSLLLTDIGERPFRPNYGSGLRSFLFEPLDSATSAMIMSSIRDTITRFEPRIQIVSLSSSENFDSNGYDVEMTFTIIGTQFSPVTVGFFLERTR